MIYQTAPDNYQAIQEEGCYYMTLLYNHAGRDLNLSREINFYYREFVDKKLMKPDCHIDFPDLIALYFGDKKSYRYSSSMEEETLNYLYSQGEKYAIVEHWRTVYGNSHFLNRLYDPLPETRLDHRISIRYAY